LPQLKSVEVNEQTQNFRQPLRIVLNGN